MGLSFSDQESLSDAVESLRCNFPQRDSDPNTLGSTDTPEELDDIRSNDPLSDSSSLQIRRMGSSSSMTPQERSENT